MKSWPDLENARPVLEKDLPALGELLPELVNTRPVVLQRFQQVFREIQVIFESWEVGQTFRQIGFGRVTFEHSHAEVVSDKPPPGG